MKGRRAVPLALLLSAGLAMMPAQAAQYDHHHDHGVGGGGLVLNSGKKWSTDEPLRSAMTTIRDLVKRHRGAGVHGYEELAAKIDGEVNYIFRNCRLEKKADDVLHRVLADIMKGSAVLAGRLEGVKADAGVAHLHRGLENYGRYFDHPGWKLH
jgi:hypothetical protein